MTRSMFKMVLAVCAGVAVGLVVLACSCGRPKTGDAEQQATTTAEQLAPPETQTPAPLPPAPSDPDPSLSPSSPLSPSLPSPIPSPTGTKPNVSPTRSSSLSREACWLLHITDNGSTVSLTSVACPKVAVRQ